MVWDPYTQLGAGSTWVQALNKCAGEANATIRRTSDSASDLVSKEKSAAYQGLSPDLLIAPDSELPALVGDQLLASTPQTGLPTSGLEPGLLAAGQVNGTTYGHALGANTVALYYNKAILAAAGVNTSSITDWTSLSTALSKVKSIGKTGITFAAASSDDGTNEFEPWLWGAGASLTSLSSSNAVSALSLWATWLRDGYVSSAAAGYTLSSSWQSFAAGQTAFAENSSSEAANAAKLGFAYGVIAIPAESGGVAVAPLEGESITIPVQTGTNRYAIDDKIVSCLTDPANALGIDSELSEVGTSAAVQAKQVAQSPVLSSWTTTIDAAKVPSNGVGTAYTNISTQLSTAVHNVLAGSATPQNALDAAQNALK
jgi:multiple sugar transport system substrate-binding protein